MQQVRLRNLPRGFGGDCNRLHGRLRHLFETYLGDPRKMEIVSTPNAKGEGRHLTEMTSPDNTGQSLDTWKWGIIWSDVDKAIQHCNMEWLNRAMHIEPYYTKYEEIYNNSQLEEE